MGVQVPLSAPNKISNLQGRDENPGLLIFPTVTVFVTITFPALKMAPDSMRRETSPIKAARSDATAPGLVIQ